MVEINIFRGVKTGKTQMNTLDEGFNPTIIIPDETQLVWERTEVISKEDLKKVIVTKAPEIVESPTPKE